MNAWLGEQAWWSLSRSKPHLLAAGRFRLAAARCPHTLSSGGLNVPAASGTAVNCDGLDAVPVPAGAPPASGSAADCLDFEGPTGRMFFCGLDEALASSDRPPRTERRQSIRRVLIRDTGAAPAHAGSIRGRRPDCAPVACTGTAGACGDGYHPPSSPSRPTGASACP